MLVPDSNQVQELHDENSSKLSQQKLNQQTQRFNYNVLNSEIQIFIQSKTFEIKSLMHRNVQNIIDIGQKLLDVKEQLGHGNFRAWLEAEFDWSLRTAARYMQVATQFKYANLANLNIAVSALYLLAQPSTSEKARGEALVLAKEGEDITLAKVKAIVNRYQEQTQSNALKPATIDISAKDLEDNSLTPSEPYQSPQGHSQLEPKDEVSSVVTVLSMETVPATESDKRLEQKAIEKINCISRKKSEVAVELQHKLNNHIDILNIEHQKQELDKNIVQSFELTFVGVSVDVEGKPSDLIILFEQMQNNPTFTEEILQQAKLLASNST